MANSENKQTNQTSGGERSGGSFGEPKFDSADQRKNATPGAQPGNAGTTGTAAATARSFYDQAKETAGQAYEAVTDKAATKIDEQKSALSGGLTTVADSVRQVSGNLGSAKTDSGLADAAAKYTETAARRIEDVAGYFDRKSVRDMAHDLENFARRNPVVFFGAAFGVGLLAARFLKSRSPGNYPGGVDRGVAGSTGPGRELNSPGSTKTTSPDNKSTTAIPGNQI